MRVVRYDFAHTMPHLMSHLMHSSTPRAPSEIGGRVRRQAAPLVLTALLCAALAMGPGADVAASQETVLLAFGDSITHGLGDIGVTCAGSPKGYPPLLDALLAGQGYDARFVTSGVCGETTSGGVSRIDTVLQFVAGDILLLMEGTNDLSNRDISTEAMLFNLNAMASMAENRGYYPVLAAPIPRDERVTDVNNDRTAFLSALLQQDAEAKDWGWVPTFSEMIDIPNLYDRFYSDPFHPNRAGYSLMAGIFLPETQAAIDRLVAVGPCEADSVTLCLGEDERFSVVVSWTDFDGNTGEGSSVPRTVDTGIFWFFGADNYELMIKVIDGREINDHFWVYYGSLSNVGFTITVTDTETGRRRVYNNPVGNFASVGDTRAFLDPSSGS